MYVWYCTNELYIWTVCKVFALPYHHTFPIFTLSPSFFTLPISPHSLLSLHFDPLTSPFLAHPTSLLETFHTVLIYSSCVQWRTYCCCNLVNKVLGMEQIDHLSFHSFWEGLSMEKADHISVLFLKTIDMIWQESMTCSSFGMLKRLLILFHSRW